MFLTEGFNIISETSNMRTGISNNSERIVQLTKVMVEVLPSEMGMIMQMMLGKYLFLVEFVLLFSGCKILSIFPLYLYDIAIYIDLLYFFVTLFESKIILVITNHLSCKKNKAKIFNERTNT